MSQREQKILVYADWKDLQMPISMGTLTATTLRGKEIFAFEYNQDWLKSNYIQLDPELFLFSGRQFLHENKSNFGLFMDSSPDRWGDY